MKNAILTLALALTTLTICNAQKIESEKLMGGYKFTQNERQMTMSALVKTLESDRQAFDLITKAQANNTLAAILGFAGGGLIGWPIGTAIGGGDPNWVLAGVGAGLVVIAIPISSSANKKAKQAVDVYNASLTS